MSFRLVFCALAVVAGVPAAAAPLALGGPSEVRVQRGALLPQTPLLRASGGRAPYTFSFNAEALPVGLTIGSGGAVSGLTCSAEGTYALGTVTVTDAAGASATDAAARLVVEAPPEGGCALTFDPTLPSPMVGVPLRAQFGADGGTAPYVFTVASGELPRGLSLSPQGELSGTPSASARQQFTMIVRDAHGATGARTATLAVMAVTIGPSNLTPGTVGAPYAQTLAAAGGTAPYRFAVSAGSLPPGLTLGPGGRVIGTPLAPGKARFTITAVDANGARARRSYAIAIGKSPQAGWAAWRGDHGLVPLAAITNASPIGTTRAAGAPASPHDVRVAAAAARPAGAAAAAALSDVQPRQLEVPQPGAMFSALLAVTGGVPPYRFDVVGAGLPPGLVLEPGGQVWGRAQRSGSDDVLLRVTDRLGDTLTVPLQVSVGARPDAAADATVAGLQMAGNEALKRLSAAQMQNVWTRLDGDVACRPEWEQRIHLNAEWVDARPYGAPQAAAPRAPERAVCGLSPSMWAVGTVDYGQVAGAPASDGYRFSTPGLSAGVDLMPLGGLRSGIALGYGQDLSDLGAGNRVESRSDSITAYGSWQAPLGVRVNAALGQARTALDVQRVASVDALLLQGQRRVSQRYAALAGSTRLEVGEWQLAPRLGVEAMRASIDGYTETDGPLALAYDATRLAGSDLRGGLALRREWRAAMWTVEPEFSVDWHRRLQGSATQPMRYADEAMGATTVLTVPDPADEFALLGLGVRMRHPQGWLFSLGARGMVDGGALRSNGYSAAMQWPL